MHTSIVLPPRRKIGTNTKTGCQGQTNVPCSDAWLLVRGLSSHPPPTAFFSFFAKTRKMRKILPSHQHTQQNTLRRYIACLRRSDPKYPLWRKLGKQRKIVCTPRGPRYSFTRLSGTHFAKGTRSNRQSERNKKSAKTHRPPVAHERTVRGPRRWVDRSLGLKILDGIFGQHKRCGKV